MNGPDFSHVTSVQQAEDLVRRGDIERLLLLPSEFGGVEVPENVVYIPAGISALKERIDQGDSFIPIAIRIEASDPGAFSTVISIWGDALNRGAATAG